MGGDAPFHHRATLKQKNKSFKSKHATKSTLRDKSKGKIQRVPIKGKVMRTINKIDRKNSAKVEQRKKREEQAMVKRLFSGRFKVPKLVAVVPLCSNINTSELVSNVFKSANKEYIGDSVINTIEIENFKQSFKIVELERNYMDILDAAKVADYLVLAMSAVEEVDEFGKNILTAIQAQGTPTVVAIVQHTEKIESTKEVTGIKKSLLSFVNYFFPSVSQVYTSSTPSEAAHIVRNIANTLPEPVSWRNKRPYITAESVNFVETTDQNEMSLENDLEGGNKKDIGDLEIIGYVRGANLSANRLIHIPNHGNFQIKSIYNCPQVSGKAKHGEMDIESGFGQADGELISVPDPENQDDLISSNIPDTMNNEQTWPEENDDEYWKTKMAQMEADEQEILKKHTKRDEDQMVDDSEIVEEEEEEYEDIEVDEQGNVVDGESKAVKDAKSELPDAEESQNMLEEYLKSRSKQSNEDKEFPDEVDTPLDVPAHIRFARYRGLQSFRTSPWDPYENLPLDYARIFQLQNPKNIMRSATKSLENAPVTVGTRVKLVLQKVPKSVIDSLSGNNSLKNKLFNVYGLLQYENKMTVMHYLVRRHQDYNDPIKSKDPLVLHCGFRKMIVNPIYSQFGNNKSSNNVYKFERFFQPNGLSIATVFAPITFGNMPVLMYLPESHQKNVVSGDPMEIQGKSKVAGGMEVDGGDSEGITNYPTLVATGSIHSIDPTRIIAKRIMLTGLPYKINKRTATIRFMFYNPVDINYFKPIQLSTKYGKHGHITESLGTHGYMKCRFNGPIKGMDTICMNLYKRVYPKWTTKLVEM
ncbi:hypothetical protein BB559_000191 [Furculomyces boomerangus]|uniref:Bms1-type G domain-containing protein n=1 Tax=Furculomyces boomerangus TaxID=61424 RepID=A0A2T9Z632_9FUNG|nr:hypothetical protein BB559_000191 [Furculomyces boomerangus]